MNRYYKTMGKCLCILFAMCSVFFCRGFGSQAANVKDLPTDGEWVTQRMVADGDEGILRWRLVVPSDGKVEVTFQAFRDHTYWELYNEDETTRYFEGQINSASANSPSSQSQVWYLSKGTYYFVAGDDVYGDGGEKTYGGDGDLRMKAVFTSANTTETEPNNSFAAANSLVVGKTVRGILTEKDDREDFYRIQVSRKSEITFRLTALFDSCKLTVYDKDYVQVFSNAVNGGSETAPKVGEWAKELTAGTYYLKVEDNIMDPGTRSGIYELKWSCYVPVSSVSLNKTSQKLTQKGQTITLKATVNPSDATDKSVTWHSDNLSVATVTKDGTVKAVSNGTANITVVTNDKEYSATCKVTVAIPTLKDASLKLPKTTYAYTTKAIKPSVAVTYKGKKLKLGTDYTVSYQNNKKVGTATVTVSGKGKYIGKKSISFQIKIDTKKTYTAGDLKYKITSASKKTVQVVGMKSKSKTTVTVPATVKILGTSYKVTKIQEKAFRNNKKLKTLIIGANVKEIDAKAFWGCSKLSKIQVNSKSLTKVGTNALKGTKKNIRIELPRKYYNKYKVLFDKKGQSKIKFVKK